MTLTSDNNDGFAALASSTLPNIGGDPLQPSWSRSLHELMASNEALLGGNAQRPTAAAKFLLGDRTDFGNLASSLAKPKPQSKTEAFGGVVESSRKHRDGIIERILKREREQTERFLEKAAERQREEDWAKERAWWMEEIVGTRNFVDPSNKLVLRQPQQTVHALPGPSHNLLPDARLASSQRLDTSIVKDHLELVKSLSNVSDMEKVLSDFQRLASSESNIPYAAAWELLGCMLPRMSSPINGALGALVHFCRQYQNIIKDRVNAASLAGQNLTTDQNYGSGVAGRIAAYVKLEVGSSATIWHILYFCLRCGDFVSAKNVLDASSSSHVSFPEQPMICRPIVQFANRQGNASCIWETGVPTTAANDLMAIADLYEKTQNLEPQNTFKIGVLALLSGRLLASFQSVEDYLFARLWHAVYQQDPVKEIQSVGESIKKYGPSHFGADESEGWGYALPLLAAQQFKTALVFLAGSSSSLGLLQAVHLGLVMSLCRVDVKDFGQDTSSSSVVTDLLVSYASVLEVDPAIGPIGGLEYLLKIPDKNRVRQEISNLIGRAPQVIDQLSGGMAEEGLRGHQGVLDRYLPVDEVNKILSDSAEIFRQQSHDRQKANTAALLFMRSGRFDLLLSFLNELISPTDQFDDDKRFFENQCEMFDNSYLRTRTAVTQYLESRNCLNLVLTNQMLRKLRAFFDNVRSHQFNQALSILSGLELVPLSQDELDVMANRYREHESILKEQFPALLSGTIRCLYGLHRTLKSESRGVNETVLGRLKELQLKSRYIYVFSGLIGMPDATKEDIRRMKNNMG